jgi:hypothetical protein
MAALTLPINELSSFDLPPVCLITGERNNVTFRKVKFAWYPRWVALLIFVPCGSWLLAAIVAAILTKRAAGELPFTDEGWSRWRLAKLLAAVQVLWIIGALFAGYYFGVDERIPEMVVSFVAMLALPLAVYFAFQRNRMVTPARITETEITLKIPSEVAAMAIREHLHAGQPAQPAPAFAR